MGTNLSPLLQPKPLKMEELKGKIVAIDAFNMLYQFITTIRQQDGSYLMDSKGNITSHLIGLFSRTTKMLQTGIKPVFVFDGKPPELKRAERERRRELKNEAQLKYEQALEKEDVSAMRKFAGRTAKLTTQMINESKQLLEALGVPVVQAPSEGEAQVAHMVAKGDAYAGVSQDYDSLLHGNPKVVRNLSVAGKRKKTGALGYKTIMPELIKLEDVLNTLGIDQTKLIWLSTLVGTDYNIGGIKGIGPKKALTLVKKHSNAKELFTEAGWTDDMTPWDKIIDTITGMPLTDNYNLEWQAPDEKSIKILLSEKHEFSSDRIDSTIKRLQNSIGVRAQKGLGDFF